MRLLFSLVCLLVWSSSLAQSDCGADYTPIFEIQGGERRSSLVADVVTTQGVITGIFLGEASLSGFFIQDIVGDGNSKTADGLFINLNERSSLADIKLVAGDLVRVSGKVLERNELTQLDRLEALEVCGYAGLQQPTPVSLPLDSMGEWEQYEGMLVSFERLTVAETYNLGRYGEVLLAAGRLYQANNGQISVDNALRQILLNDSSTVENPARVPYLAADETLRLGDTVANLEAVVVNYGLDAWRLEPVHPLTFQRSNPRETVPAEVGGSLQVATYNVLNYFTSLNGRGAASPEEFARQEAKLLSALGAMNADVYGLIEIENNGDEAIARLTAQLNERVAARYTFVPSPAAGTGSDQIRQAIIYDEGKLELLAYAADSDPVHDRPPLGATFKEIATGEVFTLIVVHFKSKGSCPSAGDTDLGQGCWNLRRAAQAQALAAFASTLSQQSGDPDVLIVGDLNSYGLEDPIQVIKAAGFSNLDERLPIADRYSYVFAGELGTLDYALASSSLDNQVTGFDIWHINSDEPRVLDYTLEFNPPTLYRSYPFRSSDHDPLLVGLELTP